MKRNQGMKGEILHLLQHASDYVSGQELSKIFGVSRTSIWKSIKALTDEGYEIEGIQKKGYRLVGANIGLSASAIEAERVKKIMGRNVRCFEEVTSTNDLAKRFAEDGVEEGFLVVSDRQSAGRGRRGRNWSSPSGSGIYMSLILRPNIPAMKTPMITIIGGMAICKGVRKITGLDAQIKWPNDVVINGKKICGILTELSAEIDHVNYVVLGIGINVNTEEFPEEIKDTATSLKIESKKTLSRIELINCFLEEFERLYQCFIQDGSLGGLVEEYDRLLVNRDREVYIIEGEKKKKALAKGITKEGHLRIVNQDGVEEEVMSGEVSVRGIYGYV